MTAAALLFLLASPALAQAPPADAPVDELPHPPVAVEAPAAPVPPAPPAVSLPIEFSADNRVHFDAPRNDVFGMGEEVHILAQVADNALAMGRNVDVQAPVDGDVFGMGETVRIRSMVMGDLYAMAGTVIIEEGAVVQGSVHALAGDIVIKGAVGHHLSAGAGSVTIDGPIGGDVELSVGELELLAGARIDGDLRYEASTEADNASDVVQGDISYTESVDDHMETIEIDLGEDEAEDDEGSGLLAAFAGWTGWRIFAYATTVLLGLVVFGLGGGSATRVGRVLREKPAESLGVGFATLMLLPPVALMCIVTVIPSLLGLVGFLVWGVLLLIAKVFVAQALGDTMLRQWRPDAVGAPIVSMAVGLLPLVLLFGIPWLGGLAQVAVASLGMGAVLWATRSAMTSAEA